MARRLKKKNSSWDKTDKRLRKIIFKALKKDEKLGLERGVEDNRLEVVAVREGSQAYQEGVEKGYRIVSVNKIPVNVLTVKSALRFACISRNDFTIEMQVPLSEDAKVDEQKNHLASSRPNEFVVELWYNIPDDESATKNISYNRPLIFDKGSVNKKQVKDVEKNKHLASSEPDEFVVNLRYNLPDEFVVKLRYNLPDDDREIKNNIFNCPTIFDNGSIADKQVKDVEKKNHLASSRSDEFVVNLRYNVPDDDSEIKNNIYNKPQIIGSGSIADKQVKDVEKNNSPASSRPKEFVVNLRYNLPEDESEIKNNVYIRPPVLDSGSIPKKQVNGTGILSGDNDDGGPFSLRELGL